MKRPITIAGGGLAGLSLGIALRERGVAVDLHEAGAYPRHRVCGEFICGVSPETLETLGIFGAFTSARKLASAAWFRRDTPLLHSRLDQPAWGISRFELDSRLRDLFQQSGGWLHERSRLKSESREGLVWSAGRIPARSDWLGLKCHLRDFKIAHDLEMHLGRGCYVGLARIEDDQVNLCGLFRKRAGMEGRGSDLVLAYLEAAGLESLASKIRQATRLEDSFLGVAGFQLGYQRDTSHEVSIGDAYAMIPPFTGNGMSMAFESAALAIEPLTAYANGALDWNAAGKEIQRLLGRRFSLRMRLARVLHPFLIRPPAQILTAFIARRGLLPYNFCFHALR